VRNTTIPFSGELGSAGFPFRKNRIHGTGFYRPEALPVTQSTVSIDRQTPV